MWSRAADGFGKGNEAGGSTLTLLKLWGSERLQQLHPLLGGLLSLLVASI